MHSGDKRTLNNVSELQPTTQVEEANSGLNMHIKPVESANSDNSAISNLCEQQPNSQENSEQGSSNIEYQAQASLPHVSSQTKTASESKIVAVYDLREFLSTYKNQLPYSDKATLWLISYDSNENVHHARSFYNNLKLEKYSKYGMKLFYIWRDDKSSYLIIDPKLVSSAEEHRMKSPFYLPNDSTKKHMLESSDQLFKTLEKTIKSESSKKKRSDRPLITNITEILNQIEILEESEQVPAKKSRTMPPDNAAENTSTNDTGIPFFPTTDSVLAKSLTEFLKSTQMPVTPPPFLSQQERADKQQNNNNWVAAYFKNQVAQVAPPNIPTDPNNNNLPHISGSK